MGRRAKNVSEAGANRPIDGLRPGDSFEVDIPGVASVRRTIVSDDPVIGAWGRFVSIDPAIEADRPIRRGRARHRSRRADSAPAPGRAR
ncbi:MAG: hypothetical protein MUF34_22865 [Polyangiaceae bacterium]|jgi:hypothetical protein|nr:hypothetical protein [Polyangiaceae bacterium]